MPEPIVFIIRKMPVARAVLTQPEVLGLKIAQLMVMMESDIKIAAEGRSYTTDELALFVDTAEAEMRLTVTFTE